MSNVTSLTRKIGQSLRAESKQLSRSRDVPATLTVLVLAASMLVACGTPHLSSQSSSHWSRIEGLPFDAVSVSCPRAGFCMMGDANGRTASFSAGEIRAVDYIGPYASQSRCRGDCYVDISCPSTSFCAASVTTNGSLPNHGYYSFLSNGKWTTARHIPHDGVGSVSCSSSDVCVFTSAEQVIVYLGMRWQQPVKAQSLLRRVSEGLSGTTCPSVTTCLAFSVDAEVFILRGSRWYLLKELPLGSIDGSAPAVLSSSMSCVDSGFCVLTQGPEAWVRLGNRWQRHSLRGASGVTSISCASSKLCIGTDSGSGLTFQYNGRGFSKEFQLFPGIGARVVACAGHSMFCIASSGSGEFRTY